MKNKIMIFFIFMLTAYSLQIFAFRNGNQDNMDQKNQCEQDFGSGKNQSPIDISVTTKSDIHTLQIEYQGYVTGLTKKGHALEAVVSGDNTFNIDGVNFKLLQFHFHTPSENLIEGKQYPLEAHFVHADKMGNLAVVAVMFNTSGKSNSDLQKLIEVVPEENQTVQLQEPFNIKNLLSSTEDYYRFNGSLTTPPYTEGVRWFVLKEAQKVSREQAKKFMYIMGNNSRPVQPLNARLILRNK